jgi:hypothetical protein
MREKTIEAMERRKERDRINSREKRAAKRAAKKVNHVAHMTNWPTHKVTMRRMMPKLPDMTKAELRAMLAAAFANTAAL